MNTQGLPASASGTLTVEQFAGDSCTWDTFVERQAESTFCHWIGWREVIESALGHRGTYLVALDAQGEWHGVLPLVRVKSRLFGDYLVSMPFLNYGGALGAEPAKEQLNLEARRLAETWNVKLLELRSRHVQSPSGLLETARKVVVLLPLPPTAEELWLQFPSKLRSQIRRPLKENMEVCFGPEQREPFYDVFRRNMHALGTPVLPAQLFADIERVFHEAVVFGAVYWQGIPIAGGCGFMGPGEFEMTWASSLQEHNARSPNMLLYWSFMQHAIERGARIFNFGRCSPDGGTHRFKRQWGGETHTLPWLSWSPSGVDATPNPDRPAYRLATRVWTRIPAGIAGWAGPRLSRNIP